MNTYTITEAQRKRLIGAMEEGYMGRKYAEYVEAMEMLQSLAPSQQQAQSLLASAVLAESDDDMELTDAQILTLWEETYVQRGWTGIEFARAIERAHGIGVKQ